MEQYATDSPIRLLFTRMIPAVIDSHRPCVATQTGIAWDGSLDIMDSQKCSIFSGRHYTSRNARDLYLRKQAKKQTVQTLLQVRCLELYHGVGERGRGENRNLTKTVRLPRQHTMQSWYYNSSNSKHILLPSAISITFTAAAAATAAVPILSNRPSTKVLPSRTVNVARGEISQPEATSNNGLAG